MKYHPRPNCRSWPDKRLTARASAVLASRPHGTALHHRRAELLHLLAEICHRTAAYLTLKPSNPPTRHD